MQSIKSLPLWFMVLLALSACNKEEPAPVHATDPAPAEEEPAPVENAAAESEAVPPDQEEAAFDAKQTFNTVCATCHGQTGAGDGPAGVALKPKPASFNDPAFWETRDRDHIVKVIKEGGAAVGKSPLMAAFGAQFSDEQIGELADYVMTFKPAE